MSKLYSQQEISEMLKELQIEKEKAQNMAEAYYRMNAIAYDLNLHINEANKQIKIYKKALDMACEQLWDDFSDCDICPVKNNGDECSTNYCGVTSYDLMNYFLKEASEK